MPYRPLLSVLLVLVLAWMPSRPTVAAGAPDGLEIKDIVVGEGATAVQGATITVHYTGWLLDGTKFDSSRDRARPFSFQLGGGRVIPGWDMGFDGMKVGGKRQLIVGPDLAYGARGAGRVIPPDATLRFEVELLAVEVPKYTNVSNEELAALLGRGAKLVDIRLPSEWKETGVVASSHQITFFDDRGRVDPDFEKRLAAVAAKGDEVVLICRTGNRTQAAAKFLAERAGYEKVYNVTRGIKQWIRDGRPVDRAAPPADCWLCAEKR